MPGYDDEFYDDDPDLLPRLYVGTVVRVEGDEDDPESQEIPLIGRIKFTIPGLMEPESGWALPFGAGGAAKWGRNMVPPKGADVFCMFINGDPDQPVWIPGWHGEGESFPEYVDPRIQVMGFGPFRFVLDNRADPARVAGSKTGPFSGLGGKTITVAVNLADQESVTLTEEATTAEEVASIINTVERGRAYAVNGSVVVESTTTGESATLQLGGSAAADLGLDTSQVKGTGTRQMTIKAVRDVKGTEETMTEIVLDADGNSTRIYAGRTLSLVADGLIDLDAQQVQIKGRVVMPSTKPIQ